VPRELGGGGAEDCGELADMVRILAHGLRLDRARLLDAHPSGRGAGLALAPPAVRGAEPLLRRIAAERIILLSSGGSDWIGGSGIARQGRGRLPRHGAQGLHLRRAAGDILMTGAILEEEGARSVLHFGAPMKARRGADRGHLAHPRHARHRLATTWSSTSSSCPRRASR
jgi:indole-3-acetate monooxygenase